MSDQAIQRVVDRDAIREVLYRYCRGVDRKCRAELEQVYWPDGTDDHGHAVDAAADQAIPGPEYVDRVLEGVAAMRTAHHLTNILIEFDGADSARSEAYFVALHELDSGGGGEKFIQLSGRYLDRFEKRGGAWRIARRLLVFDFEQTHRAGTWTSAFLPQLHRRGGSWPDDPLFALMPLGGLAHPH